MNPNDNKNRKNGKGGGGSWRGVVSLVGWALVLTIVVSYASSVLGSTGRQASSVNIEYSQFVEMVEDGQVEGVKFDDSEPILLITPAEGFAYTRRTARSTPGQRTATPMRTPWARSRPPIWSCSPSRSSPTTP